MQPVLTYLMLPVVAVTVFLINKVNLSYDPDYADPSYFSSTKALVCEDPLTDSIICSQTLKSRTYL
jgi:hypothetical protein